MAHTTLDDGLPESMADRRYLFSSCSCSSYRIVNVGCQVFPFLGGVSNPSRRGIVAHLPFWTPPL